MLLQTSEAEYDQFIWHNCAGHCRCEDCEKYRGTILPELRRGRPRK